MTGTATAKQISYIADLEAKSGHSWTEYVRCPAGATLERMPKTIASKVIDALKAECPKSSTSAAPRYASTRSGRAAYYASLRQPCVTGGNCSSFGRGRSCGGYDCDGS